MPSCDGDREEFLAAVNQASEDVALRDLILQQKRDTEKLKEAQEAVIHLADLLDHLPDRERQHIAPLLLLMAKQALLPAKKRDQPNRRVSLKSHALLSVVARSHSS